jgi:predicted RND superfamily exporter protein
MKKLITNQARLFILLVTSILLVISIILAFQVETNYDMTEYLPRDSQTLKGLDVLDETFGNHAQVELMIVNQTIEETMVIKQNLSSLPEIMRIVWMDDYVDISQPSTIDDETINAFYKNQNPLLMLVFYEDAYDTSIESSIESIESLLADEAIYFRGQAIDHMASRDISENETLKIILIIIPICFIILIFASRSWIEPVIILLVLGIGVLLNMGTNAFLPNVSFITLTIAAALQLAISLDYSLFYIHQFYELKDEGESVINAVQKAFKKAFPVITASALTTMIGFASLFFMRYRIGLDIGLVLTKGILLSYLSVIFVLPVLLVIANPLIEKLRHRHFMFHLQGLKQIFYRFRYGLLVVFILILGFGIIFQGQASYLFGNSAYAGDHSEITEHYDSYQTITLLLKDSSKSKELTLIGELNELNHIDKIDALYTVVPPTLPDAFIPEEVLANYHQGDYSRLTIYTSLVSENQFTFDLNDQINQVVENEYETYYSLGTIPSTSEIRDTVLEDTPIVLLVSVGLIFIVLLIVFKNVLLSLLLIAVIQAAIWFNVGLLAVNDRQVIYIGYLVVLALQLGATIDYAVLFASRYKSKRQKDSPLEALAYALKKASIPIMISGFVLASAGFAEMLFSEIQVVSDIGLLIGRGALLSLGLVLLILPALLLIFDKWLINLKVQKNR